MPSFQENPLLLLWDGLLILDYLETTPLVVGHRNCYCCGWCPCAVKAPWLLMTGSVSQRSEVSVVPLVSWRRCLVSQKVIVQRCMMVQNKPDCHWKTTSALFTRWSWVSGESVRYDGRISLFSLNLLFILLFILLLLKIKAENLNLIWPWHFSKMCVSVHLFIGSSPAKMRYQTDCPCNFITVTQSSVRRTLWL